MAATIPVYVPATPGEGRLAYIVAGSGIVGRSVGNRHGQVVVYYEGNLYGAVNLGRYAERVRHAYWRMVENYPTVAMSVVPGEELAQVGWFDPDENRVAVIRGLEWGLLAAWLGGELDEAELEVTS